MRERFGLPPLSLQELQSRGVATGRAGARRSLGGVAGRLAQRGVAIINLLGAAVPHAGGDVLSAARLGEGCSPRSTARCRSTMPTRSASSPAKSNAAIAGYLRGQALVCLCLGSIYAIGLSLVGLQFGLVIGLIAGAISFIPFVGTFVGAVLALGMALAQFPPDWIGVRQGRGGVPGRPDAGRQRAVAQAGRRPGRAASGLDHVRAAGRRLAVRLRRRADRRAGRRRWSACWCAICSAAIASSHLSRQRRRLSRWSSQLTFDLALPPPTYAREDFVVADGNREALAWIDRWPDWPAPALALSGPPGSGKTHLGRIWAARAGAAVLDGSGPRGQERRRPLGAHRGASPTIADRRCRPRARARAVPSLQSDARAARPSAAGRPSCRRRTGGSRLPDLASRLRAAPAVAVAPPDDELLGSIILKQLADRQLHAGARRRAVSRVAHGALGRGGAAGGRGARPARARPNGARSTAAWRPTCWRNCRGEQCMRSMLLAASLGLLAVDRPRRSSRA